MMHILQFLALLLLVSAAAITIVLGLAVVWRRNTRLRAIESTIRLVVGNYKNPGPSAISDAEISTITEMIKSRASRAMLRRLTPLMEILEGRPLRYPPQERVAALESIGRMIEGERRSEFIEASFLSRVLGDRAPPVAPLAPARSLTGAVPP